MNITTGSPVVLNFTRHQTHTVDIANTTWKITVTQTRKDTWVTVKPQASTPVPGIKFDSFESAIKHYRSELLKDALSSISQQYR